MSLLVAYDFGRHYLKRAGKEFREFRARIALEGGSVTRTSRVGLFIRSPFSGLRMCPLYYCFEVRYGDRRGSWYVAASAGGASEWVWSDVEGHTDLPVVRTDGARVDNSVIAFEYITGTIISLAFIGVFIGALLYLFLR